MKLWSGGKCSGDFSLQLFRSAESMGMASTDIVVDTRWHRLGRSGSRSIAAQAIGYDSLAWVGRNCLLKCDGFLIFTLAIVLFPCFCSLMKAGSVPFSVLLALPLGAFGAIVALHFLPNLDNNILHRLGLIYTDRSSCKTAILIVEFAKSVWM